MKRFRTGLVVGKFCPLHRGHEAVIERAFEQCDEVIVISYTRPEFPGCEPEKREGWLRARFPAATTLVVTDARARKWFGEDAGEDSVPENDAEATAHRRFVGRLCVEVLNRTVDVVFTSEDYGDGFALELGRFFAERQRPTAVAHVCVDPARARIPISGSQLRRDPHGYRSFLSPEVYGSFVRRVALLGGESTGKSTLAEALAARYETARVAEFGRELWEKRGGRLEFDDLVAIAEEQRAREQKALRECRRFLFCDTTPLTTLFYSHHLFGRADARLIALANLPYDLTILCSNDFAFVQDGTRDPELPERQQRWYETELARRGVRPLMLTGSVENRMRQCDEALG